MHDMFRREEFDKVRSEVVRSDNEEHIIKTPFKTNPALQVITEDHHISCLAIYTGSFADL